MKKLRCKWLLSYMKNEVIELFNIVSTGNWASPQRGRIYSKEGLSPALNTCGGGGLEPKIVELDEE